MRMRRRAVLIYLLLFPLAPGAAHGISATCLPGGFPTEPTPPVATQVLTWGSAPPRIFRVDIWRVACQDSSGETALLLRATPQTALPFVCASNFDLVQGGQQFDGTLRQPGNTSFCGDLLNPTTFSLEKGSVAGPPFDNTAPFQVIHNGGSAGNQVINVAGSVPQLAVSILATGCTVSCQTGDTVSFTVRVTNPGPALVGELKAGARLPDNLGTFSFLPPGTTIVQIPAGHEADFPLFSGPIPPGLPGGVYTIEAALLEPNLGTTIVRNGLQRGLIP